MKENYKKIKCDLCGKSLFYTERKDFRDNVDWVDTNGKVIEGWQCGLKDIKFTTNQEDGYPSEPYISKTYIDICPDCYKKYLELFPIVAYGAQGCNTFKFRDENK